MDPLRHAKPALATAVATVALIGASAPLAGAAAPQRHGGPGGGGPAPAARPAIPPTWPRDVPVLPGSIQATGAAGGNFSVTLLVRGSAPHALQTAVAFYRAHGFKGSNPTGFLRNGAHKLRIVVENRDHSNARTFVVVAVSRLTA
jgi:hypothetical protein